MTVSSQASCANMPSLRRICKSRMLQYKFRFQKNVRLHVNDSIRFLRYVTEFFFFNTDYVTIPGRSSLLLCSSKRPRASMKMLSSLKETTLLGIITWSVWRKQHPQAKKVYYVCLLTLSFGGDMKKLLLTICRPSVVVWAFCNPLLVTRQWLWCQPSDMEHRLEARRKTRYFQRTFDH